VNNLTWQVVVLSLGILAFCVIFSGQILNFVLASRREMTRLTMLKLRLAAVDRAMAADAAEARAAHPVSAAEALVKGLPGAAFVEDIRHRQARPAVVPAGVKAGETSPARPPWIPPRAGS
jgi:hypothetical protein